MSDDPSYSLGDTSLARLRPGDLREGWRNWLEAGEPASFPEEPESPLANVHTLKPFEPAWLGRLTLEFERFNAWTEAQGEIVDPPNSMHAYGVPLVQMGLDSLANDLLDQVIRPLAKRFYANQGGADLTGQYSFTVEYGDGGDFDLDLHVDDAAVTANLCLPGDFEGSELIFEGLRCPQHWRMPPTAEEVQSVQHDPGTLLLHLGGHRHRVEPIAAGRRLGLILWAAGPAHGMERFDARLAPNWCGICADLKRP